MSILNFLAQIMSGNIQVDPEMKSEIAKTMAGQPSNTGILNQVEAGAGRGVVNPPLVNPEAPRPVLQRQVGSGRGVLNPATVDPEQPPPLQPLQSVEVPSLPPVVSVQAAANETQGPPTAARLLPTIPCRA